MIEGGAATGEVEIGPLETLVAHPEIASREGAALSILGSNPRQGLTYNFQDLGPSYQQRFISTLPQNATFISNLSLQTRIPELLSNPATLNFDGHYLSSTPDRTLIGTVGANIDLEEVRAHARFDRYSGTDSVFVASTLGADYEHLRPTNTQQLRLDYGSTRHIMVDGKPQLFSAEGASLHATERFGSYSVRVSGYSNNPNAPAITLPVNDFLSLQAGDFHREASIGLLPDGLDVSLSAEFLRACATLKFAGVEKSGCLAAGAEIGLHSSSGIDAVAPTFRVQMPINPVNSGASRGH